MRLRFWSPTVLFSQTWIYGYHRTGMTAVAGVGGTVLGALCWGLTPKIRHVKNAANKGAALYV